MAPRGIEPPTYGLGNRRSILLSYGALSMRVRTGGGAYAIPARHGGNPANLVGRLGSFDENSHNRSERSDDLTERWDDLNERLRDLNERLTDRERGHFSAFSQPPGITAGYRKLKSRHSENPLFPGDQLREQRDA